MAIFKNALLVLIMASITVCLLMSSYVFKKPAIKLYTAIMPTNVFTPAITYEFDIRTPVAVITDTKSPKPSVTIDSIKSPSSTNKLKIPAPTIKNTVKKNVENTPVPLITYNLQNIIDDMTKEPDGAPHGVPENYSWADGRASVVFGVADNMKAAMAWGQLYVPKDFHGVEPKNTRVQIRNMKMYILSNRDNTWIIVQNSKNVAGSAFVENFKNNDNIPADIRKEPDGGISTMAGEGYNFHFWPADGRCNIDPLDVGGVFVTVEARLIIANPGMPDDHTAARYILSVGGDWWKDTKTDWLPDWSANRGIGSGRFKLVKNEWQSFSMTTLSVDKLRENPPPLN